MIDVLAADDATVEKLGLTHEQISDRIEYFINAVNNYPTKSGKIIDKKFKVSGTAWRGDQACPWGDIKPRSNYSNMDFVVENLKLKKSIFFPGLIVHLIRKHHFYEGKESPYRIDPKLAAQVLEITPA